MDYGGVLTRAWQIIWKHKVLWIFGIFAGCSGQGGLTGGGRGFTYRGNSTVNPSSGFLGGIQGGLGHILQNLETWQIVLMITAIMLVILIIALIFIFLNTMGKIGLIRGTYLVEQGNPVISFSELFKNGLPYFWRVFLLNLLIGITITLAVMILVVPLALSIVGLCILIPLACLLTPLSWGVAIVIEQANIAVVVENLGILEAISRGWEIAKAHISEMLVMGLILIVGAMVIGAILVIPFFILLVPSLVGIVLQSEPSLRAGIAISGLCLVVYLPVLIVLNGILQSYIHSAWTITYLRLIKQPTPTLTTES
jgi:hypothetical protein